MIIGIHTRNFKSNGVSNQKLQAAKASVPSYPPSEYWKMGYKTLKKIHIW